MDAGGAAGLSRGALSLEGGEPRAEGLLACISSRCGAWARQADRSLTSHLVSFSVCMHTHAHVS